MRITLSGYNAYLTWLMVLLSVMLILVVKPVDVYAKNLSPYVSIISKDTTYQNASIDLSNGSFQIINNATLKIENCNINGNITPDNPAFFKITSGHLVLKHSTLNVNSAGITSMPQHPALYYIINVLQGDVDIINNKIFTNKDYTVGFLTTGRGATRGIKITNNEISRMHGGILLKNSSHASIKNNKFTHVSSSNIFIMDSVDQMLRGNIIMFSGNNNVGDGIDISDSSHVTITKNYISSGSCYSLMILHGKNISITDNKILSGITYAISIVGSIGEKNSTDKYLLELIGPRASALAVNQNIAISHNYFSQNRFGIAADNVDVFIVKNNLFIQRFVDNNARKFWTNNDILLKNMANVTWRNNLYKEAYSQDPQGDNSLSNKTVTFPQHGGVVL